MISQLISWLPSGFTLFTASGLLLTGLGLLIYQYFYLLPHRTIALLVGTTLVASSMYLGGAGNQKAIQEYQALQAELKAANDALKLSEELSSKVKAERDQALVDKKIIEDLDKRIQDAISKTNDTVCFDSSDTERLRSLWK